MGWGAAEAEPGGAPPGGGGEGHRERHALQHPAGKLVRVGTQNPARVGDLHLAQRLLGATGRIRPAQPGDLEHLGYLPPDLDGRVERAAWLLVHHGHRPRPQLAQAAAAQRADILAVHGDRPRADPPVPREVASDRESHGRLARAGLADQPERLSRPDLERDVTKGEPVGAPYLVAHVDVRGIHDSRLSEAIVRACPRSVHGHGTTTASIQPAMRLIPTTSDAIASAGNSVSHQYPPARHW